MMSLNRLHKALLFIFPIFSLLLADAPAWSINPAEFQYNGSVTSKVYIDGDEVGSTSDLVAAFVGDEVRGVINGLGLPPFLGGGYSFNVMIFSNEAGGETVSFQYYDSSNDVVIELDETLEFMSDMVVGNATAPFELNGVNGGDTGGDDGGTTESCGDQTTWSVNPASFQYNGSVTSKVYLSGDEVGATDDMLAAFVGDELRGVINGLALPPFLGGGYSFNIMIFSNEAAGEIVEFKFYQASSNSVICLNETIEFMSDMVIGNATSPFQLTGDLPDSNDIFGCMISGACNFNPAANVDDGSCSFSEENYDCDGNCTAELDCAGECGGSSETDECGICGGNGIPDGYCDCNGNMADCAGDCGGSASEDNCGVCAGDNSTCDPVIDFSIEGGSDGIIDILLNTSTPISGFQFDVDGMTFGSASAASGGSAEANGFMVSTSNGGSMVLGFSLTGSEIPVGDGLLTSLTGTFNDVTACLSNIIVSQNATGFLTLTGEGECVNTDAVLGCTDASACNYDAAANVDDGTCSFAEENFNCEGNCLVESDCAGECGGNAVVDCNDECGGTAEFDECGVCDGLGAIYECGCDDFPDGGSPDPGTIPENTLTVLEEDGIVNIYMNNTTPVGGFQFTVNGMSATGASGGLAQNSGFMVSASGSTVIGFSLTGSTIENGSGLLTSLTGSVVGELSMSNLIISDSIGGSLDFDYFDLSSGGGEVCDCEGNILDECGECGGDSSSCEDCNGVPNGLAQLDNCGSCDDDTSNDCVEDCNGVWGGSAYEITLCEDTDGDGLGNPGSEVTECVEGGRDVTNGCDLAENTVFITSDGSVFYNSTDAIGGFQFSIDGATASSASGGDAGDAGFMISAAGSMVIGFSLTGATFGPACGTLTNIAVSGNPTSLSDLVFSDALGGALNFTYYVESGAVDMVADCSDEHPDCGANFFDCLGECGGSAVVDECGICDGEGIAEGACDCDGNVPAENEDCDGNCLVDIDCAGECGGSAFEVTLCEDTDGDGLGNPGSEVTECVEGGRDVTNGCDLADNTVFITSDGSVFYNSTDAIGGFQFNIDGATASGASGGDAGTAGFMMSAAGNTVIGFSMTGATFGPGCGTLADLAVTGNPTSLSNLIFSDAFGGLLSFTYYIEVGDMVADCSDEYPDCTSNIVDCEGSCDGSAEYDCADVCGGSAYEANLCEDTDGDGLGNPGSEVLTCIEGGRDITSGCDLDANSVFITSEGSVLYNSTDAIGGFQFNIDGATASGASGGDAGAAGFMMSAGGNTVIGFSMTGATFGPGCGTLADLAVTGNPTSLSNLIFSDAFGGSLSFTYYVEAGPDLVMDCSDEFPDCSANEFDCAGECGGTAVIDECGECGGGGIADGSCDCEGNVNDCAGECGGSAMFDECGVCGGDGIADGACDCDGNPPAENYNCEGNCIAEIDCAGECSGSASLDDCGVCNGGNADQDCAGECGGAAEVDNCGVCGGGNADQDCNGDCFGSAYNDDCDVCVGGNTGLEECSSTQTVEIDLHGGANLISMYALPDDRSVSNIMSSLEGIVTGVIGEGVAASPNPILGWVGSLSEFEETSGYWLKVNADATLVVDDATPLDPGLVYNLHSGANLISFPYEGSVGIAEGLPDDIEGLVTGIIGEGVAASPNPVLGWVGSLTSFQGTKGYWMKMSADASFSFNISDGLIRSSIPVEIQKSPIGFDYNQSTQQAFYFVEDIVLDGESIQDGDWVMAYNGNVLVGARQWNGAFTDIPVMGYDSHVETAGYLENGETPTFKVIRENTGEEFVISGNLPVWANNELYTVGVMEIVVFPSTIVLQEAYPNPFNPSTHIEFGLSNDADVRVIVYDIAGREMAVLAEGQFSKGFHNVIWDAADQPSGIYFVTVSTQAETQSQKLMLIK